MLASKAYTLAVGVVAALAFAIPCASAVQIGGAPHPDRAGSPPTNRSGPIIPPDPEAGTSGSSGGPALGGELGDSDGLIRPPAGVDPGIAQPPPNVDPR